MARIALIPGDGVGPELTRELRKVLDVVKTHVKKDLSYEIFPWGGKHFVKHGESLGPDFIRQLKQSYRGVFIGGLGDPAVYRQNYVHEILGGILHGLKLHIVEKPVYMMDARLCPLRDLQRENFRVTLIRDSIEGLDVAGGRRLRREEGREIAVDSHIYDEEHVAEVIEHALTRAAEDKVQVVPLILRKALFPNTHRLWEKVYSSRIQARDMVSKVMEMPAFLHGFLQDPGTYPMIISPGSTGELLGEVLSESVGGKMYTGTLFLNREGKYMAIPDMGSLPGLAGTGRVLPQTALMQLALIFGQEDMITAARVLFRAILNSFENQWLPPGAGGSMSTESIGDFIASYVDEQLSKALPQSAGGAS